MIMALRVTIMLDEGLTKKLRLLQAKRLKGSKKSISFSTVLNEAIRKVYEVFTKQNKNL